MLYIDGVLCEIYCAVVTKESERPVMNVWIQHVKAFQAAHPDKSWKECLGESRASYTPTVKEAKSTEKKENPWMTHIAKFKTDNPKWKESMSYKDVLLSCKATYTKAVASDSSMPVGVNDIMAA